jgi:hypothetical protein
LSSFLRFFCFGFLQKKLANMLIGKTDELLKKNPKETLSANSMKTAGVLAKVPDMRNSFSLYYNHFRSIILQQSFWKNSRDFGVFELDESYFGGVRKGKRGRGAAEKADELCWAIP